MKKQFSKCPYHTIAKPRKNGLLQVFDIFTVAELREDLEQWRNMALCANESIYDDSRERENMLLFTQALNRLIEALYILIRKKYLHALKKEFPEQTLKTIKQNNTAVFLTQEEQQAPGKTIKSFTQTFTKSYARSELLDMLDAAISYKGPLPSYRGTLVLLYKQLDFMVRLSYRMKGRSGKVAQGGEAEYPERIEGDP